MPSGIGEIGPTAENANGNAAHQTDANKLGGQANFGKQMTQDHTSYVSRARVTRTAPPKPASNPLQFIQTKPFSLYKGVKEPVKRAEEVVKVKEIIKDEPEDWQSNLDSWKSCRRKRVEHIIDRVVEVKKLELEEHDRQRRKSKTFSEMMEDRGSKGRKVNLKIYAEDDSNDLSDLGIGTSSASGKSSLSEDFDNNSVLSDNPADNDKSGAQPAIGTKNGHSADGEYDSSTGSDVPGSSSLSPTHSVRPAATKPFGLVNPQAGYHTPSSAVSSASSLSKDSTPERSLEPTAPALVLKPVAPLAYQPPIQKRPSSTKIEDRLLNFEIMGASQQQEAEKSFARIELPKVDVLKRRELFESAQQAPSNGNNNGVQMRRRSSGGNGIVASMAGELSAKASSIKNRVSYIEQKQQQEKPLSPSADAAIVVNAEPKAKPAPTPEKKPDPVTTEAPDLKNHITIEPLEDGEDSGIAIDEATIQAPDETKNVDERPAMAVQPDVVPQANIESIEMIVAITSSPIEQNTETEPMLPSPEPTVFVEADAEPTATLPTSAAAKQIPAVDNDDDDDEQETSVIEALELAFKAIDIEHTAATTNTGPQTLAEPIYENIDEINELYAEIDMEMAKNHTPFTGSANTISASQPPTTSITPNNSTNHHTISNHNNHNNNNRNHKHHASNGKTPTIAEQPAEPYYQVPNAQPIPLYENVEIMYTSQNLKYPVVCSDASRTLEPPKEKPPPPPTSDASSSDDDRPADDSHDDDEPQSQPPVDPMKRMNSTRRIKKEIRNKRTSFLGINDDGPTYDADSYMLLSGVPPPPTIAAFMQQELRLDKQLQFQRHRDASPSPAANGEQRCDDSASTIAFDDTATDTSRDSGVSDSHSHSRQSSEPALTTSSEELHDVGAESSCVESLLSSDHLRCDRHPDTPTSASALSDATIGDGATTDALDSPWPPRANEPQRLSEEARMRCLEEQIREQEQVLRVERELLQLEQEQLRRQRDTLHRRETQTRSDLSALADRHQSMYDISASVSGAAYENLAEVAATKHQQHRSTLNIQQLQQLQFPYESSVAPHMPPAEYRKSMPNLLQADQLSTFVEYQPQPTSHQLLLQIQTHANDPQPPVPPAKPLRAHHQQLAASPPSALHSLHQRQHSAPAIKAAQSMDDFLQLRHAPAANQPYYSQHPHPHQPSQHIYSNLTKHALHALSATPKPKLQDAWVQQQHQHTVQQQLRRPAHQHWPEPQSRVSDAWLSVQQQQQQQQMQQKRRSEPNAAFNYNQHWLVQEAEQRRIDQQRSRTARPSATAAPAASSSSSSASSCARSHHSNSSSGANSNVSTPPPAVQQPTVVHIPRNGATDNKPLPEAVIQTLTQRVHNRGLLVPKRSGNDGIETATNNSKHDLNGKEILSISGKKKCSYCDEELGRGAAMIIESLRLFYHLDCFKCCVCRVQLGDGVSGADVRVRNQKLHCHNCFSSDDGIKFSCV